MRRKIKYDICLAYTYQGRISMHNFISVGTKSLTEIIENNFEEDTDGDKIIDWQFFGPDGKKCDLEDIYEEVVPEVGTFWNKSNTDLVVQIVLDREKTTPDFDKCSFLRFLTLKEDSYDLWFDLKEFKDFTQVKNWQGDPIE